MSYPLSSKIEVIGDTNESEVILSDNSIVSWNIKKKSSNNFSISSNSIIDAMLIDENNGNVTLANNLTSKGLFFIQQISLPPLAKNFLWVNNPTNNLIFTDNSGNDINLLQANGNAGGDLTGTYPNPSLTNTGVTSGTYGSSTQIPSINIDSKGRITSATSIPASLNYGSFTVSITSLINDGLGNYYTRLGTVPSPYNLVAGGPTSSDGIISSTSRTIYVSVCLYLQTSNQTSQQRIFTNLLINNVGSNGGSTSCPVSNNWRWTCIVQGSSYPINTQIGTSFNFSGIGVVTLNGGNITIIYL